MKSLFQRLLLIAFLANLGFGCQENKDYQNAITDGSYQIAAQDKLTTVIINDIFSPPVASRIYAYSSLAAYEVTALSDPNYQSMMGQLNGFEKTEFDTTGQIYYPLASLAAYYKVATALIFSERFLKSSLSTSDQLSEAGSSVRSCSVGPKRISLKMFLRESVLNSRSVTPPAPDLFSSSSSNADNMNCSSPTWRWLKNLQVLTC